MIAELLNLKNEEYALIKTSNKHLFGECDKTLQNLITCLN